MHTILQRGTVYLRILHLLPFLCVWWLSSPEYYCLKTVMLSVCQDLLEPQQLEMYCTQWQKNWKIDWQVVIIFFLWSKYWFHTSAIATLLKFFVVSVLPCGMLACARLSSIVVIGAHLVVEHSRTLAVTSNATLAISTTNTFLRR
jgi:hypothetical protein